MIARPSVLRRALLVLAAPVLLALVAAPASAQGKGKGHGNDHGNDHGGPRAAASAAPSSHASSSASSGASAHGRKVPPGQAKKHVTHAQAVDASKDVLVRQGYVVKRVERRGDTRVIWFYRGNNGRGKGHGPLQKMVVRPAGDRYAFDGAPSSVVKAVNMRLRF